MYVDALLRVMRCRLTHDYNANVATIGAVWRRLCGWPPLVFDSILACVLTFAVFEDAGARAGPALLLTTVPLVWRRPRPPPRFRLGGLGAARSPPPTPVLCAIMISAHLIRA